MLILRLFIFLIFCCLTLNTNAEDTDSSSDKTQPEIVEIQSYRLPTTLKNASANVTIIDRNDIDKHSSLNVAELLTRYGLHVEQAAGPGSLSSIYLRGADPNYTLVLINGTKVNDPTNSRGGSFDFSSLDLETIERIEIVRGPLSSAYGSDALSGVINIITKEPKTPTDATANVTKGENGLYSASSTFTQISDTFNYSVTGSYQDSGEQVRGTELVSRSGDIKGTWVQSDATSINWHARYYDNDASAFPEDSGGSSFAVIQEEDRKDVFESLANVELTHILKNNLELSLKSSVFHHQEDTTSPGVAPGLRDPFGIPRNETDSEFTRYAMTASGMYAPRQNVTSVVGMNVEIEEGETNGFLDISNTLVPTNFDLNRTTHSFFTELEAFIGPSVTVQSGLRFDMPENYSDRLSPKFGVSYKIPNTETSLRLLWGKGFKLPSFFALGNPIVGNANIKPETSETFEIGFSTNLLNDQARLDINVFTQEFENTVDFEAGPPPKLINRNEVTAEGIEFAFLFNPVKNISTNTYINHVDKNIKNSSDELLNRPDWRAGFSLNWNATDNLNYNLHAIYVDDVIDSSIPTGRATLDDYTRIDVSAAWSVLTSLDLIFAVDNLFDTNYEETIGNSAPGIAARFQLSGNF